MKKCKPLLALLLLVACWQVKAQLSLTGQLRTRTEYRNGNGTLKPVGNEAAFFTSQRTRLSAQYHWSKVDFKMTFQDVRVWGQDASTISNADGSRFSVHEAWANLVLSDRKDSSFHQAPVDYLSLKVGRQELLYADSRLMGNLDWLQQGRRHDAIVLKMLNRGWQLDLGAAFNQNTDGFNYNGTYYTPANVPPYVKDSKGRLVPVPAGLIPVVNTSGISDKAGSLSLSTPVGTNGLNQQYKALQFLYGSKKINRLKISGLVIADHFSRYGLDSIVNYIDGEYGFVYGRRYNKAGVNSRVTGGLLSEIALDKSGKLALTAGAYYQAGKDREGRSVSAWTGTASILYKAGKWSCQLGWDYLSGNDAFTVDSKDHRFDPLYGTPHKFWGFMDYFYVGTGAPAGGLSDPYAGIRYRSGNRRFASRLDVHAFSLANDQKDINGNAVGRYLGTELDWINSYELNPVTHIELGIAGMFASSSMEYAKGVVPGTGHLQGQWVYLQLNVNPELLKSK